MSKKIERNNVSSKDKVIRDILNSLKEKHTITEKEVLKYIIDNKKRVEGVPVSIFRSGLSPLQSTVKYLVENGACTFSEIARLLNRDQRTIWNTYKEANLIHKEILDAEKTKYVIELGIFRNRKLSFLENLCCYLKENYGLSYHQIALELGKDDRTIWTVCKRAERKRNDTKLEKLEDESKK